MSGTTERGEGWEMHLGDCLEVMPGIGPVALTFTSPPYNTLGARIPSNPSGMWGERSGGLGFVDSVNVDGYPDDMAEHEYQAQQITIVDMLYDATASGGCLFYNHKCRWRDGALLHPVLWMRPRSWKLRAELIWNRSTSMTMNARMWAPSEERVLWFEKSGASRTWNQPSGGNLLSVWSISHESGPNKPHPVSFPVELPSRAVAACSNVDDTILDPFAGSGTTGVACLRLGRRFIGIEKDPTYFALACERLRAEEQGSTLQAARAGQLALLGGGQ